jgi:hypothetical protein
MHKRFGLLALTIAVLGSGALAQPTGWPPLPKRGFITGRIAQEADIKRRDAIFLARINGQVSGHPAAVLVPQYAILTQKDGTKLPAIVVQAEVNERGRFYGLRDFLGGEHVATAAEVKLIGTVPPKP